MGKKVQGTGTVRQRKNGLWEGQYYFEGKRKSIYGKTQESVRIELNSILNDILIGAHFEIGDITLGEWLATWLAGYSKPTVRHSTFL